MVGANMKLSMIESALVDKIQKLDERVQKLESIVLELVESSNPTSQLDLSFLEINQEQKQ